MNMRHAKKALIFFLLMFFFLTSACARKKVDSDPSIEGNDKAAAGMTTNNPAALPQVNSFADDIKDILIPPELEWNRKESMAIKTESFRGGVFVYNGKAEILSLKDYLVASMQDNKWRAVGETSGKDIMLAFMKPNKTCMMVLSEAMFGKTDLRLYVTIDNSGSAGGNPFGDPIPRR